MEGPLAPGAANGTLRTPSPTPPAIDPQILADYLEKVLDVNLGASEQDLRAPGSLLSSGRLHDTLQRCTRFALESQTVLYVVKDRVEESRIDSGGLDQPNGETPGDDREGRSGRLTAAGVTPHYQYTLATELSFSPNCAAYIVIMKRPIPIDPAIPLSQPKCRLSRRCPVLYFLVITLLRPTASPYRDVSFVLSFSTAVEPYFDGPTPRARSDLAGKYSKGDNDARTGVHFGDTEEDCGTGPSVSSNLEQNVEIPELLLNLSIPLIQECATTTAAGA